LLENIPVDLLFSDTAYPLTNTALDPLWAAFGPLDQARSYAHLLAGSTTDPVHSSILFDRLYLPMNAYHTLFWTQLLPPTAPERLRRDGCTGSELLHSFAARVKHHVLGPNAQQCTSALAQRRRRLTLIRRAPTPGRYRAVGRMLLNEAQVLQMLRRRLSPLDWEVGMVDLAELEAAEQILRLECTDLLVGMHGAGLVNLIWMRPNAAVLVLFPMHYHRDHFARLSRLARLHYAEWRNTNESAHFPHADIAGHAHRHKQAHTLVDLEQLWSLVSHLLKLIG